MDPISQQTQPTQAYQPSPAQTNQPVANNKKVGTIVAILIIILILIIGALYLFASKIDQEQVPNDSSVAQSQDTAAAPQTVQPVTNKADDLGSLEADLNSSTKGLDNQSF